MKKGLLFFIIFVSTLIFRDACAEKETVLPPIIITPSRIPRETALQSASAIQSDEFGEVIGTSVTDIASGLPSLDVRERGVDGVQADLNIRGATFEESSVLINGVRVNDPQTGHHNMDIPLTSMDLEGLELLRGGGSALYGPDAFGGVLNIITKKPAGREASAAFSAGSNNFLREAFSISQPVQDLKNRVSFERKDSTGYRGKATAFHTTTFSFDSLLDGEWGELEMLGGYAYKDFGASTFYSSLYPNEHESTDTRLGIIRGKWSGGAVTVEPKIYYRRHWDRFVLDNDRPFWSMNTHKTYTLGSDIQTTVSTDAGTVILGTELAYDKIDSTNIKKHKRNREAVFLGYNHTLPFGLAVNADARLDYFSEFGLQASPSLSLGYDLNERVMLRSSVNRSYRIPSFTDLYYNAPGNIGNPGLKPESAWSYETGVDYDDNLIKVTIAAFGRNGRDVIDWVRSSPQDSWQAVNIGRLDTFGVENLIEVRPKEAFKDFFVDKITAGYDFINSERHDAEGKLSKYALNYLRHNVSLCTYATLPFGVEETFKVYYKRRINQSGYFLLESKTSRKVKIAGFDTELYFEGTNLLNTSYSEITDVPMPGIWLIGGVTARF